MRNSIFQKSKFFPFLLLIIMVPSPNNTLAKIEIDQNGWLITPEEAAMAPLPEVSGDSPSQIEGDELHLGPLIEVITPKEGDQAEAPIEVNIKFSPQNEPVDITTLKVSVVKFISIDITDRVRDYSSPQGIHVKEAKIPKGKHRVRISIADTGGMYSKKEITFEVV
ncbi:MAG: hypothetical protein H6750_16170 [Nitrospiraceae bacterium]|nr:hypothetical protein [Nitrospira sp.]MCB9775843.1 hypothetical protein [Nitrospiraceae bacterium]